jgi:hypothetical protein
MRRRRRRNPSTAGTIAGATATALAPLVPYAVLAGIGYWAWRKFVGSSAVASAAAHASSVAGAYKQAAQAAVDPSQWAPAYEETEKWWQDQGEEGHPIAQPYYGPAGEWT